MGILAEAAFLLRTGWTPDQYLAARDDLVEAMMALMNAEAEVMKAQAENMENSDG